MQCILIDMDCLLDTRLGTVATLSAEAANHLVGSDLYWVRENDEWEALTGGLVTNDAFRDAYAQRDHHVLKKSVVSGIPSMLLRILTEHNVNLRDGLGTKDLGIEINLWPYEFSDEERDTLEAILRGFTYRDLPITFCSRPHDTITPVILKERYAAWIMYDFQAWMKRHCFAVGKEACPDVTLIVPRLFEKDVSTLTKERKQEEIMDLKLWLAGYLNLEFVDSGCFSMMRLPTNPTEDPA